MSELRRTPLYAEHLALKARIVPFAGWEMPVQYAGVVEEHNTVREHVGLFDVSHMGEIRVQGPSALATVQWLLTNDARKLTPGKAQYSALANERGGAVDDVILYQMGVDDYLLCVNASNIEKDFNWIVQNNKFDAEIKNESDNFAQIAVQGPKSVALLEKFTALSLGKDSFPAFSHRPVILKALGNAAESITTTLARTGYTGEDGFELYCPAADARMIWRELLTLGEEFSVKPIGLGARDTLRLEAALCLYGHELRDDWNILEAGLGWIVKFDKGDFIGREALLNSKGSPRKLVGLELIEPGIVREEVPIFSVTGEKIGVTTSGTKTPTIQKSIALAYLNAPADEVFCEVRGKRIRAKVCKLPFYRRAQ